HGGRAARAQHRRQRLRPTLRYLPGRQLALAVVVSELIPFGVLIALGALLCRLRAFGPDVDASIRVLNRYALYVAFPALIVASIARLGPDTHGFDGTSIGLILGTLAITSTLAVVVARAF